MTFTPPTSGQMLKCLFHSSHETFHANNRVQHLEHLPAHPVEKKADICIHWISRHSLGKNFPARVVYKTTYCFMKTSVKGSYWVKIQWLHTLWVCAKSIIQNLNANLGKMITCSGGTQTLSVNCGWLRCYFEATRHNCDSMLSCYEI